MHFCHWGCFISCIRTELSVNAGLGPCPVIVIDGVFLPGCGGWCSCWGSVKIYYNIIRNLHIICSLPVLKRHLPVNCILITRLILRNISSNSSSSQCKHLRSSQHIGRIKRRISVQNRSSVGLIRWWTITSLKSDWSICSLLNSSLTWQSYSITYTSFEGLTAPCAEILRRCSGNCSCVFTSCGSWVGEICADCPDLAAAGNVDEIHWECDF